MLSTTYETRNDMIAGRITLPQLESFLMKAADGLPANLDAPASPIGEIDGAGRNLGGQS